jgi:glycosyltransferase involved in cell wall biosynthesis
MPKRHISILHLKPADDARTAIAEYGRAFQKALERVPDARPVDFLPSDLPESIARASDVQALRRFVIEAARPWRDPGNELVVHVEQGNALHREFWASVFLRALLPHARFFATIHDPPKLCSNPYRYIRTEYANTTPFRPLNMALTKFAEFLVSVRRRRIEARFVGGLEGVVALSEGGRARLASHPLFVHVPAHYIPHVFDLDGLGDAATSLDRKNENKARLDIVLLCHIGPNKGIEELLEAFDILMRRLKTEGDDALPRLHIAGAISQGFKSENYLKGLKERIRSSPFADWIDFSPGFLKDTERDCLLAAADIVALPYRTVPTAFSSAGAIRALALGKAIVAARANTIPEVVRDGETGLLHPEDQADALADCLHRLVLDSDLRRNLGANARNLIAARHTPDKVAPLLASLYNL